MEPRDRPRELSPSPPHAAIDGPSRVPSPRYSPRFVRAFTRIFWPFARVWFRPRVAGLERVPKGPCLVVANHSGFGVMEIFVLLSAWTRQYGTEVPVAGLAHDVGFAWWIRWGVERIGGIRAAPEVAEDALRRGLPVLVFPGGDVDALRPFSARYEVRWGGRSGFVSIARTAGAPIVPLAICGSHAQYTLLPGGRYVARALGLTRFRLSTWPVPLGVLWPLAALAATFGFGASGWWILVGAAFALFPNPTRIDLRFLDPVEPGPPGAEAPKEVAEELRARLEAEVVALSRSRRTPWF